MNKEKAATMRGVKVDEFKSMERAEKRFIYSILLGFVTSLYLIAIKLSNLKIQDLFKLTIADILGLMLLAALLVVSFLAIWEYIGVSVEFEIRKKLEVKEKP